MSDGSREGIIARMPRQTRDELVKQFCEANQHLPNFEFLLEFAEKQLKLVLHLLMHIATCSQENESKPRNVNFGHKVKMLKPGVQGE